jgi:putative nucleotidyltransferase with HDIG domain
MKQKILRQLAEVNRELWLVLSLLLISAILNSLIAAHGMILSFYTLPTLCSAYFFGRRHAVLTSVASISLVILVTWFNPRIFETAGFTLGDNRWYEIACWGGMLMVTAYAMGTLYDHNQRKIRELRETYQGVLMILRQFISNDKYTQNHSHRVSIYATRIAHEMGFDSDRIEDVRAAALLHDIGKLDISRDLLYKAARLTSDEYEEVKLHVDKGMNFLGPVGGSLRRVLPIILSHHDRYDGSGYTPHSGEQIPLESRILAVADAYDALTSDRPYRKGRTPYEAREIVEKETGREFDPQVVSAFLSAFNKQELEVPELIV